MQRTLVDRARLGDEEAFDALARMVGDRCMAIACRILRGADLAEEAVQAALITAMARHPGPSSPDPVVLDDDPRAVPVERIGDVKVVMTMIGGRTEWCAPGAEALCPTRA